MDEVSVGNLPQRSTMRRRGSILDPHRPEIDAYVGRRRGDVGDLLRRVRGRGYGGSYSSLVKAVRSNRPGLEALIEPSPGKLALVDWERISSRELGDRDHARVAFTMWLPWSGAMVFSFGREYSIASLVQCHIEAFNLFGGVPESCLYPEKQPVLSGHGGRENPVWNRCLKLASELVGFRLDLWPSYWGRRKEVRECRASRLFDMYSQRLGPIFGAGPPVSFRVKEAYSRHCGAGRLPSDDLLSQECSYLKSLPFPPAGGRTTYQRVGQDGCIIALKREWPVSLECAGRQVMVKLYDRLLQVWEVDEPRHWLLADYAIDGAEDQEWNELRALFGISVVHPEYMDVFLKNHVKKLSNNGIQVIRKGSVEIARYLSDKKELAHFRASLPVDELWSFRLEQWVSLRPSGWLGRE